MERPSQPTLTRQHHGPDSPPGFGIMPHGPQKDSETIPRASAGNLQIFAILGIPSSANHSNYSPRSSGTSDHSSQASPLSLANPPTNFQLRFRRAISPPTFPCHSYCAFASRTTFASAFILTTSSSFYRTTPTLISIDPWLYTPLFYLPHFPAPSWIPSSTNDCRLLRPRFPPKQNNTFGIFLHHTPPTDNFPPA
jgi:hypothetical protein